MHIKRIDLTLTEGELYALYKHLHPDKEGNFCTASDYSDLTQIWSKLEALCSRIDHAKRLDARFRRENSD